MFNFFKLIKDLRRLHKRDERNFVILEAPDYHIFLIYVIVARLCGYEIAVISHEWGPTIKSVHKFRKPFVWLYAKTFGYMVDAILPISEFIIEKTKHFHKPYLKIPVLAEFSEILSEGSKQDELVYCVYAAYIRVISCIIDAYRLYLEYCNSRKKLSLILILTGTEKQIQIVREYIQKKGMMVQIQIRTKLPYDELLQTYRRANALIIPLNPNSKQDEARFSQKIAEYLSSGTAIITNNVGEIKYYFEDGKNVIICPYSSKGFASAFEWVSNNVEKSKLIGRNGFNLGMNEFNYQKYGYKLHSFLCDI